MKDRKPIATISIIDRNCKYYGTEECTEKDESSIICKACTKSKYFVGYKSCPICGNYMNLTKSPCERYPVLKCSHCYVEMTGFLKESAHSIWRRWNMGVLFQKIAELEKKLELLENRNDTEVINGR
jgi:hypothetical protein